MGLCQIYTTDCFIKVAVLLEYIDLVIAYTKFSDIIIIFRGAPAPMAPMLPMVML